MAELDLPLIIEVEQLEQHQEHEKLLFVDLSQPTTYVQYHIPHAVFLDYAWIVRIEQPRLGLLPDPAQLTHVLSAYGLTPDTHVVTYDDEGVGRAARFLWTLEAAGHKRYSLLNGGLRAWANQGRQISTRINFPTPTDYQVNMDFSGVATRQFILDNLSNDDVKLLDTRSPAEYSGKKVYAQRGGHIPGAVNRPYEADVAPGSAAWIDESRLRDAYGKLGVEADQPVIVHCRTGHQATQTYFLLKHVLGYRDVKWFDASWMTWAARSDLPAAVVR